jgi:hypothetical protein
MAQVVRRMLLAGSEPATGADAMQALEADTQDADPHEPRLRAVDTDLPKAYAILGARELSEAWVLAQRELARARKCECCASLLAHVYDRIGSDLFLDDDPAQLAGAFDIGDRDRFTPRVLASCIVVSGRPRIALSVPDWD